MSLILGQDDVIGPWVCERAGGHWVAGRGTTIGIARDGVIVGGVLYEDYNGANLIMHVASDGGRRWLGADTLFYLFSYPFGQLGVKRVTALVGERNQKMIALAWRLGFHWETHLRDAHPDGDLFVFSMFKDQCRWLRRNHVHEMVA